MRCIHKTRINKDTKIIEKLCNGKGGCFEWKDLAKDFDEKGQLLADGTPQLISVCRKCRQKAIREYARNRKDVLEATALEVVMQSHTPFPWKPYLGRFRVTGMFG